MGFCGYCVSLHPQFPTKALLTFSAFFLLSLAKVLLVLEAGEILQGAQQQLSANLTPKTR
jgi:hypothetical protein